MWWTLVMIIFSVYFEGILSKTASYLTRHIQTSWTGSNETWLAEYWSLLCITPINVTLLSVTALSVCKTVNTILIYNQCNYKERNHNDVWCILYPLE